MKCSPVDTYHRENASQSQISPRVLMVIPRFYPIIGGAENQALRLSRALLDMGVSVEVLTGRPPGLRSCENVEGIRVRRLEWLEALRLGKVKFHLLNLAIFREMVRSAKQFDLVHAHQAMPPAFAACRGARRLGKPCAVKIGNSGERFDLAMMSRMMMSGGMMARYLSRNADRFIAISRTVRKDLSRFGVPDERIVDIPNGVELPSDVPGPEEKAALRKRLGLPMDKQIVVYVGRLEKHKNLILAARARPFHQFCNRNRNSIFRKEIIYIRKN